MNSFLTTILLFLFLGTGRAEERPNVLFLILDDMNNNLSFLDGEPKAITPNLDRLAAQSHNFTRAYCAVPACNPTRAATLSGLPPYVSGVYENANSVADSVPIHRVTHLPEHFRANGYWTMAAGKVFHKKPRAKKYDRLWDDTSHDGGGQGPKVQRGKGELPEGVTSWGQPQRWTGPDTDFPDVRNSDAVVEKLQQPQEKPFFIALGLHRPHVPYTAPARFFDLYDRDAIRPGPMQPDDVNDLPPAALEIVNHDNGHRKDVNRAIDGGYLNTILHGYLASASFADWNVGRVLEALEDGPHASNTIVVLWGDHGFHHGEKERFTKFALWEKTTQIPLLIRKPGQSEGVTQPNPVTQMDFYPTLCDLAGLETPDHVVGRSLIPMLENPDRALGPALTTQGRGNHALRTRKYRYIRYRNGDEEFYVHNPNTAENDPNEWSNQASNPSYRDTMDRLALSLPTKEVEPVFAPNR